MSHSPCVRDRDRPPMSGFGSGNDIRQPEVPCPSRSNGRQVVRTLAISVSGDVVQRDHGEARTQSTWANRVRVRCRWTVPDRGDIGCAICPRALSQLRAIARVRWPCYGWMIPAHRSVPSPDLAS